MRRTVAIAALLMAAVAITASALRPQLTLLDDLPTDELRIGVDPGYPPLAFWQDGQLSGIEIDLGRALAERMGVPMRFVGLSFDGLFDALKTGQVDALIAGLTNDPGRAGFARFSPPYLNAGLTLVSAPDVPVSSMTDLDGRTLALELGSEADSEARRWQRRGVSIDPRYYERPAYALDAVRLIQADAALVDALTLRQYLRQHPGWAPHWAEITVLPYVVVSHQDKGALAAALDRALNSLLADGTIEAILNRW